MIKLNELMLKLSKFLMDEPNDSMIKLNNFANAKSQRIYTIRPMILYIEWRAE
jgi:hypothetical protein